MKCEATTTAGTPCKAPAMTGKPHCFHHSPTTAKERQEARRRGGLRLHHGAGEGERKEVEVRRVSDVLALLSVAASDLLSRPASEARARALAYVATAALRAVEAGDLEERVAALEARLTMKEVS